jgi:hypothetical protein
MIPYAPVPLLVHDTIRVLYANEPACALFRRKALNLEMLQIIELVVSTDFQTLMSIHMCILRERGDAPKIEYPFLRGDLSVFWAKVTSDKVEDGRFSMELKKTFEEWC